MAWIRLQWERSNHAQVGLWADSSPWAGSRPVVNSRLPKYRHFKMENAAAMEQWSLLMKNDWMIIINLKNGFLSVPIQEHHRKLLHFQWKESLHEFHCLPFALTRVPQVFTTLFKPVLAIKGYATCDLLLFHPYEGGSSGGNAPLPVGVPHQLEEAGPHSRPGKESSDLQ